MGAICGILGRCDSEAVEAMARALRHRGEANYRLDGKTFALASSTPIVFHCLSDGMPRDSQDNPLSLEQLCDSCNAVGDPRKLSLRGAFAAVVAIKNGEEWWLVRDRLGRKPLYYCLGDGFLLFASELKALLASQLVRRRLNLSSVDRYLTLRCIPGPESIIQGVRRVRPGHALRHNDEGTSEVAFSTFSFDTRRMDRESAATMIRHRLRAALAKESAGLLLWSGGIDCATLASLRADLRPIFVVQERAWQDEARLAKESARRLRRSLLTASARPLTEETFGKVVRSLDEPVADASVFPLWLVLEQVAEHGSAAITGHGADELLGGYPRYHFLRKAHGAQSLVPAHLLTGLLPALPPNAFVRRAGRYLASIRDSAQAYLALLSVFDQDEREELYTDAMKSALEEQGRSASVVREHFAGQDLMRSLLSLDLGVGIPDSLLFSCDRIAAAHGLTLSFPYLDDALVDFVLTLSARTKFGVRSKPLLRVATKGLLPPRVRLRARRGFRIPQSGRLVRVIDNVARQVITPERVDATGLFKWPRIEQVLVSATHNVFRQRQFWALLMFFAWYREVMES